MGSGILWSFRNRRQEREQLFSGRNGVLGCRDNSPRFVPPIDADLRFRCEAWDAAGRIGTEAQDRIVAPGLSQSVKPRLHGNFRPVGGTDSELAFCWLMQELAKAHATVPSIDELGRTLAELLPQPAAHGTFNCLLSNGQALWAHCSTHLHWLERQHPFGAAQLADDDLSVDFGALTSPDDRVALVATQPLTTGEAWTAFAPGELRVFVGGQNRAP